MTDAVREILERIVLLPAAQRAELQDELARRDEAEWRSLLAETRQTARRRGIDDSAIARAVESLRYGDDQPAR